ncbi:class II aldolase/adducin family protein [Nanoarchaeota archaeon]
MGESYKGTKFVTIFVKKQVLNNEKIDELIHWCKRFDEEGLAPLHPKGSAGNLSFRSERGFIITASGSVLGEISKEDFVEVVNVDGKNIEVNGIKEPSSESLLHSAIYEKRKDVNAIFHGHSIDILREYEELGLVSTKKEEPYGTIELVNSVLDVLGEHDVVIMKNHGFLTFGRDMEEAGNNALNVLEQARKLE